MLTIMPHATKTLAEVVDDALNLLSDKFVI